MNATHMMQTGKASRTGQRGALVPPIDVLPDFIVAPSLALLICAASPDVGIAEPLEVNAPDVDPVEFGVVVPAALGLVPGVLDDFRADLALPCFVVVAD